MLNFIFTATNFNDAVKRVAYLKSYRKYRDEQVVGINRTQKELGQRIEMLSVNKSEKSKVIEEQQKQKELLESEKKEKNQFVSKLKARENEIAREVAAKKKVERSLQNSIAAIIKREIEAARRKAEEEARKSAATAPTPRAATGPAETPTATRKVTVLENTPEVTKVSVGFENNRGNLPWPVDRGTITSSFGRQRIEGTRIEEDNSGITIQTESGTTVKAVYDGVVTTVYDVAGSQTVTIKHGKYFTTYFNLSSVNVSKGSKVETGQTIGRAGENFDGDGEIIFMVNEELRFVNPELWLKRR